MLSFATHELAFSCQLLCFAVPQGGRPAEPTGKSAPATFKKTFSESVTVRSFAWKDLKFTYPAPTKMDCKSGPPVRDRASSTTKAHLHDLCFASYWFLYR